MATWNRAERDGQEPKATCSGGVRPEGSTKAFTTSSGGSAWGARCSTPSANAGWSSKTGVGSSMKFARIAASGCARPRSSQPSCHPGSEGPRRILPTAQPMLDIEPDLLTLSGPQTGSSSPLGLRHPESQKSGFRDAINLSGICDEIIQKALEDVNLEYSFTVIGDVTVSCRK